MRAPFTAAIVLALGVGQALAGSYEDFNTGIAATRRGNHDLAIQMLSRALAAGDLSPSLQPVAYYDRGISYFASGQLDAAIADFSSAIRLKPDFADAYISRGSAYGRRGQFSEALADLDLVIRLHPDRAPEYFIRGKLQFTLARYTEASADFKHAVDLAPSWHYAVLLRHIALARAGTQSVDELARSAKELDLPRWPGPIVKLYMGRLSPDEVRTAASRGNASEQKYKACEADFYLGEWHLFTNDVAAAKPLLQRAAASCPPEFIEFDLAGAELRRLP